MDVNPIEEGYLPEPVKAWIQEFADQNFGGNFGQAAAAILEAAHARYLQPEQPWAELDSLVRRRGGPR